MSEKLRSLGRSTSKGGESGSKAEVSTGHVRLFSYLSKLGKQYSINISVENVNPHL